MTRGTSGKMGKVDQAVFGAEKIGMLFPRRFEQNHDGAMT